MYVYMNVWFTTLCQLLIKHNSQSTLLSLWMILDVLFKTSGATCIKLFAGSRMKLKTEIRTFQIYKAMCTHDLNPSWQKATPSCIWMEQVWRSAGANARGTSKTMRGRPATNLNLPQFLLQCNVMSSGKVQRCPIKYMQARVPGRWLCNINAVFLLFTSQSSRRKIK